jgi:hypothetical protein
VTATLPALPEHTGYCLAACGARIDLATNRDGRCGRCIADRSSRCAICQACGEARTDHDDTGHAWLGFEPARALACSGAAPQPAPMRPVAPQPTTKEIAVPDVHKKCSSCLENPAQTKSGVCKPCYQRAWREKNGAKPRAASGQVAGVEADVERKQPRLAEDAQLQFEGMPEKAKLPKVEDLPHDYFVAVAKELVRRRNDFASLCIQAGLPDAPKGAA